jgi:phenol hydroxylase P0 protein
MAMARALRSCGCAPRTRDGKPFRKSPGQQPEEKVRFHQLPQAKPRFDVSKRYVRFRELRGDGYVLFDFAIGDPELAVELTLPLAAYQVFCREHCVIYLAREQVETIDFEKSKWRYGSPGIQE